MSAGTSATTGRRDQRVQTVLQLEGVMPFARSSQGAWR
jgi:hypothetical protein